MSGPAGIPFRDRFERPVRRGDVVGSPVPGGPIGGDRAVARGGVDVEGVLAVDGGALRIQPLARPGWGRAGVAYGPFAAQPGRALAVHVLNGHQASQTHPPRSLPRQVARWLIGSGATPAVPRLRAFLRHRPRVPHTRRLWSWWWINRADGRTPTVENLTVGWFPTAAPTDPRRDARSFVVRATSGTNGTMTTTISGRSVPVIPEVHNLPLALVVVVREQGALYLAGSIAGAASLPELPALRPLAVDAGEAGASPPALFAGVHQAILGEIGFSVDTRVYDVQVADLDGLARWCTTAVLADRLTGEGPLAGSPAEVGLSWLGPAHVFVRTATGVEADGVDVGRLTVLPAATASTAATGSTASTAATAVTAATGAEPTVIGLLHALVNPGADPGRVGLAWRVTEAGHWRLLVGPADVVVEQVVGERTERRGRADRGMGRAGAVAVQVLDHDDTAIRVVIDGVTVVEVDDPGPAPAGGGIGLYVDDGWGSARVRDLEAHPRAVHHPQLELRPRPAPAPGRRVVIDDDLATPWGDPAGPEGDPVGDERDLAGRSTALRPGGEVRWVRTVGEGRFLVGTHGARVDADADRPIRGRTLYTVPWADPLFVDASVRITPPGTARGQDHRGRAGLVFWQDSGHHLVVNTWLDDDFDGSSVSSFLTVGGFEDVFDAVWVNVGARIRWGRPYTLGVRFDGMTYVVSVDDDVVLYRRLDDIYPDAGALRINRVGLAANWEWGLDTGSRFDRFQARANR